MGQGNFDDLLSGSTGGSSGGASAGFMSGVKDSRSETRKKFAGKVKIAFNNQLVDSGRMYDISMTGVSVMLESSLPKKAYTLEVDIFHDGKRYFFNVQGVPLYNILVSGKGYKIGFQFGPPGATLPQELGNLMESS
jgi:hypothetical protein